MTFPRGIRIRIAFALAGIVALALGAAYTIVVPSLEQRLVDARLDRLQRVAVPLAHREVPRSQYNWPRAVERLSVATNARVVVFSVLTRNPPALTPAADSRQASSRDVERDATALRALDTRRVARGRVAKPRGDFGDVAVPLTWGPVVLFQTDLSDSIATVHLVQHRLLWATGFALVVALVLGFFAAGTLAHRLRRLESAAGRIAGGDFAVPVVDRGADEIGQLARAFDRMRIQLEQLDTARKEFVANASHELRTPLFSLGGFLELLMDEDLDEETRRGFLTTMQTQVERLAKLSADLLDLSRVDAGQLRPAREPVELGEVARTLVTELEPVSAASAHSIGADLADEVWCLGDQERILQVGRALLANALVHTPSGTSVRVRTRRRDGRAELVIEDEGGAGIPRAQQTAVFERFYRVEGGVASGSGLGLAIAKELARLMNGSVRLESQPGRTVFTLDLPGEPAPARPSATAGAFSRENASTITR
jgi:two-component system, OmpR family, sensor kinase